MANVADRVAVMYAGQIVEYGTVEEIFYDAWHPYTWALLQALPQLGVKGELLPTIDGTPPNLFNDIHGDAFAPRNKKAWPSTLSRSRPSLRCRPPTPPRPGIWTRARPRSSARTRSRTCARK